MVVLGISALYHDAAAALIKDGDIVAAAQEERFTRKKHDMSIPLHAIRYCMEEAKICADQIDAVVYYDNPLLTLDRFIQNTEALRNQTELLIERTFESMFSAKMWVHKSLEEALGCQLKGKFYVTKHHIAHAASAFYPSPFEKAIFITIDGVGEWATTTIGIGVDNNIKIVKQIDYPHSLGMLYSAFTYFCGFKVNSGDYKFMGLAPYGRPIYYDLIKEKMIEVKEDGSYRLNMEYFDYQNGKTMISDKFIEVLGIKREPESQITRREMDIAASVQKLLEEIVLLIVKNAKQEFGQDIDNLVLAGGVALNCVANGKILRSNIFEKIWIQPAAGDAGGALGAALYYYYQKAKNKRNILCDDSQKGSYLGPEFSNVEIKRYLESRKIPYKYYDDKELYREVAKELAEEKIIGLYQGRMEFGPRALGNRSIIADPRSDKMQSKLNMKIKFRESFRPFAPSVLEEDLKEYFEIEAETPYMLLVANVKEERCIEFDVSKMLDDDTNMLPIVNCKRSDIPAVTHIDYSARIQSVNEKRNERYYNIIKEFKKMTGCGLVVNTSFNVRGEPIVCTPEDAYKCFMRTDMDVLILQNYILYKREQPTFEEDTDWREEYELD